MVLKERETGDESDLRVGEGHHGVRVSETYPATG